MDEMRAILDSLMGSDRNSLTAAPTRASFKDPGICHSYLVDFCPHDLFPNTKSDLGPCPNKHSDSLREQFLADPEHEYYRKKYEREFLNTLHRLVEGVEERIRKGQQRILGPDETQIEQDKQKKFDQMKDEIASLLQRAQEAGEKGNIAEAETFTRKVTEIRCDLDRMSNLSHEYLAISNQEKSLRVCPVCGAMQSLGDATSRFESHVSGKQHVGYERIRATYAALKAKYRPDNVEAPGEDQKNDQQAQQQPLPPQQDGSRPVRASGSDGDGPGRPRSYEKGSGQNGVQGRSVGGRWDNAYSGSANHTNADYKGRYNGGDSRRRGVNGPQRYRQHPYGRSDAGDDRYRRRYSRSRDRYQSSSRRHRTRETDGHSSCSPDSSSRTRYRHRRSPSDQDRSARRRSRSFGDDNDGRRRRRRDDDARLDSEQRHDRKHYSDRRDSD